MAAIYIGEYECILTDKPIHDCPRYICFSILKPSKFSADAYDYGIHFKYLSKSEFSIERFYLADLDEDDFDIDHMEYVLDLILCSSYADALGQFSRLLEDIPPSDFVQLDSFIQRSLKHIPLEGSV